MKNAYGPDFSVQPEQLQNACRCSGTILEGFREFSDFVKNNYDRKLMFDETFAIYHLNREAMGDYISNSN